MVQGSLFPANILLRVKVNFTLQQAMVALGGGTVTTVLLIVTLVLGGGFVSDLFGNTSLILKNVF
jgi:hypothetical protein